MDLPAITFPSVDAQSIRQIIINLTSNAIRHTPPGGCVSLSASEDSAACYLRVSDTGEGIPLKIQNSVFEAFVTCADESNASLTATESGTGLGLAITRELVVAHGGQIWFDTGEEQGTTFHIALPKVSRPDDTPIEPRVTRPETSAA
jgi:signal transduction histidine kinase